jgi:site-specific recombinase XerD
MKASISYYPNLQKKSKKTGSIPCYVRVILNGSKAEERLAMQFSTHEFQKWDPMTMRLRDRASTNNFVLNNLDQKFQEFLILNSTRLSLFTPRMILDHVMGKNHEQNITVLEFVDSVFEKSIKNNGSLSPGTVRNYKKAINHLKAFLLHCKTEKLLLCQVNADFSREFMDYLLSTVPKYSKKAMTEVSAAYIIKKFRTIFDRAVDKKIIEKNYFKNIKLKTKSPRRERLNIEQVKSIFFLDCSKLPVQKIYRDIFLFSVLTGLANIDSLQMKDQHLQLRADGNVKLSLKRVKTSIFTESFLVSFAVDIINRYKNSAEKDLTGYVLPHRSNKELNVQLKIIASLCNIPFNLTSHVARHTFRQLLAEAGIEDIAVIKRMMGQSRGDEIDEIYYSVTESRLLAAKEKFEKYLQQH